MAKFYDHMGGRFVEHEFGLKKFRPVEASNVRHEPARNVLEKATASDALGLKHLVTPVQMQHHLRTVPKAEARGQTEAHRTSPFDQWLKGDWKIVGNTIVLLNPNAEFDGELDDMSALTFEKTSEKAVRYSDSRGCKSHSEMTRVIGRMLISNHPKLDQWVTCIAGDSVRFGIRVSPAPSLSIIMLVSKNFSGTWRRLLERRHSELTGLANSPSARF